MDATIVAALIGALATLLGSGLALVIGRRTLRQSIEAQERFYSGAKAVDTVYAFDKIDVRLQFDDEGNSTWRKQYFGLRSRLEIVNFSLPYRVVTAQGPSASTPVVSALPGSEMPVRFEIGQDPTSRFQGRIVLEGVLRPGQVVPGFVVEQHFQKAFNTTRRSALAAYKDGAWKGEYAAFTVTASVSILSIEVEFPPSHQRLSPPPAPIVFTGNSELVNRDEVQRIKRSLTVADGRASLLVDKPKLGLMYGVSWLPPSK